MASSSNDASESIKTVKCSNPDRRIRVVAKLKGLSARELELPDAGSVKPWIFVENPSEESSDAVKISFGDQSVGSKESYGLDYCYYQNDENVDIFTKEVKPLISGVFDGHNSTVIAYGAKDSGKTNVIQGFCENPGLAALSMIDFLRIAEEKGKTVSISFYEVHLDHVYDLLNAKRPPVLLLDDGRGKIQLKGLSRAPVNSISEFYKLYFVGSCKHKPTQKITSEPTLCAHKGLIVYLSRANEISNTYDGKMNFVDLAGFEYARRKNTNGLNFAEIIKINKSIYALLNVLYALSINESHVPYRESKLTRLLQDSFEGTSKILMIACLNSSFCQDSIYMVSLGSRLRQGNKRATYDFIYKPKRFSRNSELPGSVSIHAKKKILSRVVHSEKKPESKLKMATPMRRRKLFVDAIRLQKSNKENIVSNNKEKDLTSIVEKDIEEVVPSEISSIQGLSTIGEDIDLNILEANEFSLCVTSKEGSCAVEEDVIKAKENLSLQSNEDRSPPLSQRLRNLTNEMRSLYSSRPLAMKIPHTYESASTVLDSTFVEYQTPLRKENVRGINGACLNSPWETFSTRSKGVKSTLVEDYLKFLNTADKEELKRLKGIGEKRATAIIEFRVDSPEPFKSLEDLKEIGLSAKQIKGMLRKEMGELFN